MSLFSRAGISLIASLSLLAGAAAAQTNGARRDGTSISGVVRDSVNGGTLANATIQLVPRDDPASLARTAESDATGRFVLNDVPLGNYRLGFFHPMLDSLGIEAPLRDVHVDSYSPVIADLAIPSPVRFRSAICGARTVSDSGAVIIGTVRDARDGSAAAKVTVTGEWLEFALNRLGMQRRVARRTATTTEAGWFALCDVPTGGSVALVATRGADSTDLIEVQIPPEGFLRRELYLGTAASEVVTVATAPSTTTASTAAPVTRRIHTGNGRLSGTVIGVASNQPLAGAVVAITDGPQTRTNDRGEWTIANAPTGTRRLEVRALGYFPVQRHVNIVASTEPVRIALSTFKAVLDTVRITASRNPFGPDGGGFQRRRKMGHGRFITPADMLKFPVTATSDVFRRIAGVSFEMDEFGEKHLTMRGCRPAIFMNGMNMTYMDTNDIDTWVNPREVAGIEVYSETTTPGEFQVGLHGCGAIVIWTR